jgi:hypothetical protein
MSWCIDDRDESYTSGVAKKSCTDAFSWLGSSCSFVPGLVPGTHGNRQGGWCLWMAGSKPGHERIGEASVCFGTKAMHY